MEISEVLGFMRLTAGKDSAMKESRTESWGEISTGDTVQLKSGGQMMTVGDWVSDYRFVPCYWHDLRGKPRRRKYEVKILTKVSK